MKRFGIGLLFGIGGYLLTAVASYFLILQFSSNIHDRSLEATMTSIFIFGPIGGVLAFVIGLVRGGARPAAPPAP
jgi:hypothetical protein